MGRPLLLDLFCGQGGAGMGYHRAGFGVLGVDLCRIYSDDGTWRTNHSIRQRYPFRLVQADALEFLASARLGGVAAIHASPPCQRYSAGTRVIRRQVHPDLIAPVRELLAASGKPWVIENVPRAPLRPDLKLCACMFGLDDRLQRCRWFETSWHAYELRQPCHHIRGAISITRRTGRPPRRERELTHRTFHPLAVRQSLMGIDWMTADGLGEAIPPAYTEHIGRQLMDVLAVTRG